MRLLTLLLILMFALVAAYFCYSVYFYGGRWIANPYNPRISSQKQHVVMGTLTDRDGTVLAYTDESGTRRYNSNAATRKAVSQVVGDSSGKVSTGADTFHAQYLLGFRSSIFERLADAFTGTTQRGDDVELTISERLSRYISEQFPRDKRGAVVVMNYKTNEILALVSMPQFDPTDMDSALVDEAAGALVNRATQGLYPPGSTFKTVTALAGMEYLSDWQSFQVECTGERVFQDKVIHCYNNKVHGMVDMKSALAYSCNCYFAALADEIGAGKLAKTMRQVGMDADSRFELETSRNSIYLAKGATESELVETAIGQGRTGVTPLYMAMLASAFANDGMMMKPYIVDHVVYPDGTETKNTVPEKLTEICTAEEAAAIRDMMIGVVSGGTGTAAAINGVTVAGKTGTAENATGYDHSWFIGFAPAENPKVAVAVVIENANYGSATPIAGKVMQAALAELEK